jgi:hypothetical protein
MPGVVVPHDLTFDQAAGRLRAMAAAVNGCLHGGMPVTLDA